MMVSSLSRQSDVKISKRARSRLHSQLTHRHRDNPGLLTVEVSFKESPENTLQFFTRAKRHHQYAEQLESLEK